MKTLDIVYMLFWVLVVSGTVFCFSKSLKRLFQVTSGLVIFETYNALFDIGLWPVIQGMFRVHGVIGLTVSALILNFIALRLYQKYSKSDWLGITIVDDIVHKAESMRNEYNQSHGLVKVIKSVPTGLLWVAERSIKGKWVPFLILSLFMDSFYATAYHIRWKNKTVTGVLSKGDYFVFFSSTLVGCFGWTLFTEFITLPAFKSLWQTFAG